MKKKLLSRRGISLVETLITLAVVALIGMALIYGSQTAAFIYRDSTRVAEAETLCDTIMTVLEDEYRFAHNINLTDAKKYEDADGNNREVGLSGGTHGMVTIDGASLLGNAAYTSNLEVRTLDIAYDNINELVTITAAVGPASGPDCVTHTVTVKRVNG